MTISIVVTPFIVNVELRSRALISSLWAAQTTSATIVEMNTWVARHDKHCCKKGQHYIDIILTWLKIFAI